MHVRVRDICPTSVAYREDGERLRETILSYWNDTSKLVLDFEDTPVASVSFFDEAIAVLLLQHPIDTIRARIELARITAEDRALLNRCIATRLRQAESTLESST